MSITDLLLSSPAPPFGSDTGGGILSKHPGPYPMDLPLGLGLDLDGILSPTLLWNDQVGITWKDLNSSGISPSAEAQTEPQGTGKSETPEEAERDPQARVNKAIRRRSKADPTISNRQTKLSQREQHLERNRLAASRCREKKREQTQHFETRFREEEQEKKQLENDITALRGEILDLKEKILGHALCDGRVGQYLAHMTQHVTQGNAAGTSSLSGSESLLALSPVSASLVRATSPTATASSLSDEPLSRVPYVDEEISGGINGETASHGSGASYSSVDETVTELVDAYTHLT